MAIKQSANLSDRTIKAISTPDSGHAITWDTKESRFGLRTTSAGVQTFILQYRSKHPNARGKNREVAIARYPDFSATRARDEVRNLKARIANGEDPLEERRAYSQSITLGDLCDQYTKEMLAYKKTSEDGKRFIDKEILPRFGASRKAADIERSGVREWFKAKTAAGSRKDPDGNPLPSPVSANRMLELLRRIYTWGSKEDKFGRGVNLNPTVGIDLNKESPNPRHLSDSEIKDFLERIDGCHWVGQSVADALRLTLFTAQRSGEVVAAEWSEIDLVQKVWKQPAEKTKNGNPNTVPLNSLAIEVLKKQKTKQKRGETRVLPGLNQKSLARALNRKKDGVYVNRLHLGEWCDKDPFTPHSLRHTAISQLSELGVDRLVISKLVNHKDRTITGHYDHAERTKEKRLAVEKWDRELRKIMGEEQKVVSISG